MDIDLSEKISVTKREAIQEARAHLDAVVRYCLDSDLTPDKIDCDHIREAHRLLTLALK